jgi:dihydrolipoamide dehydrogenase
MIERKDKIVHRLTSGIATLFKANQVEWVHGTGKLLEGKRVEVSGPNACLLRGEHIILASGSKPNELATAPVNGETIVDSSGALEFSTVPERLGVIGAGVIGLELGSVWARLGSQVVLLEAQQRFLSMADEQIAKEALRQYRKQGLDIQLGQRVTASRVEAGKVTVSYEGGDGENQIVVDRLIVAVGRSPCTEGLYSRESGLELDEKGFVDVNERCRTNRPDIYAVGDLVRGPMLAHKGSEEGVMVAELIAGRKGSVDPDLIPSVIYTAPEVAWVGKTEQDLKSAGENYRVGSFPFAANGRALAMQGGVGLVKLIASGDDDRLLGAHIIGPNASELIAETVLAMEFSASSEDIARTIHAHPTLSEAVHEAALAVDGRALHTVNRAR